MAQDFNIRITAVDNATKVINKINGQVGKLFQPYERAKKSTASFFDAIGKNDLVAKPLWALGKIGGGISSVATSFGIAENSVLGSSARMAASIGAIGGPIGGFIAGAVVAAGATTSIAVKMGQFGYDIARTAKNLNITTDQLQEYRGAAKLAGLQTETMDASLGSLGTTLQDAAAGRNLQAATLLSQMGVSVKRTKDGAVDTVAALRDISDVVSRIKDQNMARKIGDMLGVSDLLPMLREGSTKMNEWIAEVRRTGGVMTQEAITNNEKQNQSWLSVKQSIDGAGTSLGNMIAQYTHLDRLASNTTGIAAKLQTWADKKAEEKKERSAKAPEFTGATSGIRFGGTAGMVVGGIYDMFSGINGLIGYNPKRAGGGRGFVQPPGGSGTALGVSEANAAAGAQSSAPRGIRNNNPGNLNYAGQAGASKEEGPNGRFATFASPEMGITALAKNLVAYQDKYGINTIEKIVNRWAPPSENNTGAYVARVSKDTGQKPDAALNLRDPATLAPLISSIIKHENGQNPYDADTIAKAAAAAVREAQGGGDSGSDRPIRIVVEGLPAGASVKAVRGLGQPAIGMTMQPGGTS